MRSIDCVPGKPLEKPNDLLYHYTGLAGLQGIVEHQELWASNIWYLNDTREYLHATEVIKDLIRTVAVSKSDQEAALQLLADYQNRQFDEIHTISLSEHGDRLSQWRGYCSVNSGYSIGFDKKLLVELAAKQGYELVQCIYDKDAQEKILLPHVQALIAGDAERIRDLGTIAPRLKHPSFSEEQEWRLVIKDFDFRSKDDWGIRQGNTMLIPYTRFTVKNDHSYSSIYEIVIGPTPEPELAKHSLSKFMFRSGLYGRHMRLSTSSFKTFQP